MGWAGMLTVILPMLMQSCQNWASIAKYDPVSTFTNGRHPNPSCPNEHGRVKETLQAQDPEP
jgi:hypothetical protein